LRDSKPPKNAAEESSDFKNKLVFKSSNFLSVQLLAQVYKPVLILKLWILIYFLQTMLIATVLSSFYTNLSCSPFTFCGIQSNQNPKESSNFKIKFVFSLFLSLMSRTLFSNNFKQNNITLFSPKHYTCCSPLKFLD